MKYVNSCFHTNERGIELKKSEVTKERIATAARAVFASEGFDRSTIRAIANKADINPAMVMRYFQSKEALFATVVQFDLRLPDLATTPSDKHGEVLVGHFLDRWEARDSELAALLRAAVTHPAARARLMAIFQDQLMVAVRQGDDTRTAFTRAALIASQMLGLALTRYVLGFDSALALDRATIVKSVGATIQAYLEH